MPECENCKKLIERVKAVETELPNAWLIRALFGQSSDADPNLCPNPYGEAGLAQLRARNMELLAAEAERDELRERVKAAEAARDFAEEALGVSGAAREELQAEVEKLRQWDEGNSRLRMRVEQVLDVVLGTEEEDGSGEGLVGDVQLLADRATRAEAAWARVKRYYDDGYALTKPLGGDCPDCQTPYEASVIGWAALDGGSE